MSEVYVSICVLSPGSGGVQGVSAHTMLTPGPAEEEIPGRNGRSFIHTGSPAIEFYLYFWLDLVQSLLLYTCWRHD